MTWRRKRSWPESSPESPPLDFPLPNQFALTWLPVFYCEFRFNLTLPGRPCQRGPTFQILLPLAGIPPIVSSLLGLLAPALISLDAKARIAGPGGERTISLEQFFVLPTVNVRRENVLKPGEILTEILIPLPAAGTRSTYWKQMERDAWDFALVSVATAVRVKGG